MNRRTRKREARRQEMLQKAMEIVERDGLEGLTIARLAETLDAAVGALYRYFPGKDALLFEMQQMALEDFYDALQDHLQTIKAYLKEEGQSRDKKLSALLQLMTVMRAYLEDAQTAPARHRLMFEFMSSYHPMFSDEDAHKGEDAVFRILSLASEAIAVLLHGPKAPKKSSTLEFPEDVQQETLVLWALVHGLDHFRKRDRLMAAPLHSKSLLAVAQHTVFSGWGIPPNEYQNAFQHADKLFPRLFPPQEAYPTPPTTKSSQPSENGH